jgi:hypothetical protein
MRGGLTRGTIKVQLKGKITEAFSFRGGQRFEFTPESDMSQV